MGTYPRMMVVVNSSTRTNMNLGTFPIAGDSMLRKGFRQRAGRYVVFLATFTLLFSFWAALLGKYDAILAALKMLPFSLAAVVVLDLLGLGPWVRKSKVRRAIPTVLLVLAIVVVMAYGELWAAVPLLILLAWIVGYVLRQRLSMRRGHESAPPQA